MIEQQVTDAALRLVEQLRRQQAGSLLAMQRNEVLLWAMESGLFTPESADEHRVFDGMRKREDGYGASVRLVAKLLGETGIPYAFIKAFREHPFANTDVNLVVRPEDFPRTIALFVARNWSIRSAMARAKEWLAERGKRKIVPPAGAVFAEVHLYPAATWHGVTYLSADWVLQHSGYQVRLGAEVSNVTPEADLLLHYGHCAFERYNLTLGELYHHQLSRLRLGETGLATARATAADWGWGEAFDLVDRTVAGWWETGAYAPPPIQLSREELRSCWVKRAKHYHLPKGDVLSAVQEVAAHQVWAGPIYEIYRGLKRLRNSKHQDRKAI